MTNLVKARCACYNRELHYVSVYEGYEKQWTEKRHS